MCYENNSELVLVTTGYEITAMQSGATDVFRPAGLIRAAGYCSTADSSVREGDTTRVLLNSSWHG